MPRFDAIVLGLGGMGSSALYHLARRSVSVLGLEQFQIAHDRGSSHGATRLIRRAYFEHPDYVPLLNRAYVLWEELEAETGQRLFERCGLVLAGRPSSEVIRGVQLAARLHDLAIETLHGTDRAAMETRFRFDADMDVLYEADAGFLHVEACVRAHCERAVARGAIIRTEEAVRSWRAEAGGVVIETDDGLYTADRLVICGGPWSRELVGWAESDSNGSSLNACPPTADSAHPTRLPLCVRRVPVFWMESKNPAHRLESGCPAFGYETESGFFYGFPAFDERGLKAAQHLGRQIVADPLQLDRAQKPDDLPPVAAFLQRYVPGTTGRVLDFSVCMYTMTPDEHFIIDVHPEHPNVVYAAGFSGHGFKFASVVGEILADLSHMGQTDAPIGFLSAGRWRSKPC